MFSEFLLAMWCEANTPGLQPSGSNCGTEEVGSSIDPEKVDEVTVNSLDSEVSFNARAP